MCVFVCGRARVCVLCCAWVVRACVSAHMSERGCCVVCVCCVCVCLCGVAIYTHEWRVEYGVGVVGQGTHSTLCTHCKHISYSTHKHTRTHTTRTTTRNYNHTHTHTTHTIHTHTRKRTQTHNTQHTPQYASATDIARLLAHETETNSF